MLLGLIHLYIYSFPREQSYLIYTFLMGFVEFAASVVAEQSSPRSEV